MLFAPLIINWSRFFAFYEKNIHSVQGFYNNIRYFFGHSFDQILRQYQKHKISVGYPIAEKYTTKGIRFRMPFVAKPSS